MEPVIIAAAPGWAIYALYRGLSSGEWWVECDDVVGWLYVCGDLRDCNHHDIYGLPLVATDCPPTAEPYQVGGNGEAFWWASPSTPLATAEDLWPLILATAESIEGKIAWRKVRT